MIRTDQVFQIGYISRTHGTRGEIELSYTDDPFDRGSAEYLVMDMDGILVPFFFEQYRYKGQTSALFMLEGIDSEQKARKFVGTRVYYPIDALPEESDDAELSSIRALTGFEVKGVGRIIDVDDSSFNILLTILRPDGNEILVPYHDDFLVSYDLRHRTLKLDLPDGLLEL